MSLRTRRKSQTREALIQAVLEQGSRGDSFSSMSLRAITKEAGVVPAAFYRHFKDMEDLGKTLVDDYLTLALSELLKSIFDKHPQPTGQISARVNRFLAMISERPDYWQFLVTERWGGSPAVRKAIKHQVVKFESKLAKELSELGAFGSTPKDELKLLAHMVTNLFFSWIPDWIELQTSDPDAKSDKLLADYTTSCAMQAKILFYGAAHLKMSTLQAS